MTRSPLRWAMAAGMLVACSGSGDHETPDPTASVSSAVCADDSRAQICVPGLEQACMSGARTVRLLDTSPAPVARGNNVWRFQVLDTKGAPEDGLSIQVKTFMPDHGHSSSIIPLVTPVGGGTYELSRLNLFMPGLWQLTFLLTGTAMSDSAVVTFCLGG